jgi:recombination protein RecR
MDSIEKLTAHFLKFPGIGRRQARRFAYHLLSKDHGSLNDLANLIKGIKQEITECASCHCFFAPGSRKNVTCDVCRDPHVDPTTLLVVEKDFDMENIQKSGAYAGRYFVLGGTLPLFDKDPNESIRAKLLFEEAEKNAKTGTLKEIIIALSVNPEGEHTTQYVAKILEPLAKKYKIKVTTLGRGLSTGTELEYSDSDTLKNALKNRG